MLILSAVIALLGAFYVFFFGEEKKVRFWFLLLASSISALAMGLWVELNFAKYAFLAARMNMTTGLIMAFASMVTVDKMCRVKTPRYTYYFVGIAAVLNIITVWASDLNFTGKLIYYSWGIYVEGDIKFIINPLLVAIISIIILTSISLKYSKMHPLDKNRVKYIFLSFFILAISLLDYLPHFNIDLLGGSASQIAIPLFIACFGYANLKYRLFSFKEFSIKFSGWIFLSLYLMTIYILILNISQSTLHASSDLAHKLSAVAIIIVFTFSGRKILGWVNRFSASEELSIESAVDNFSKEIQTILEEPELIGHVLSLYHSPIGCDSAKFLLPEIFSDLDITSEKNQTELTLVELETVRRKKEVAQSSPLQEHEILIVVAFNQQILGYLALGEKSDGRMYSDRLLTIMQTLANVFTIAMIQARNIKELERSRIIKQELAVAARIQKSILPKDLPQLNGLAIATEYIPMIDVGGDYYDFHIISDKKVGIFIADVSGHGIAAALISSMVRFVFSTQKEHAEDPQKLLNNMNRLLLDKMGGQFITASYSVIDLEKNTITNARAGHPPVFLWSEAHQKVIDIYPKGSLIGYLDDIKLEPAQEETLHRGDKIIMLTDGILEAPNDLKEMYEEERLRAFLKDNHSLKAQEFKSKLLDNVTNWSKLDLNNASYDDDITLIVLDII